MRFQIRPLYWILTGPSFAGRSGIVKKGAKAAHTKNFRESSCRKRPYQRKDQHKMLYAPWNIA